MSKSIPNSAQYVTQQRKFSRQNSVIYFFSTLPIRLKLGLHIGVRLRMTNHLDQSETGSSSQIIIITLFCGRCYFAVPFTSLSKLWNNAVPKRFCWGKPACSDFSPSKFIVYGHIFRTTGDALTGILRKAHVYVKLQKHKQSSDQAQEQLCHPRRWPFICPRQSFQKKQGNPWGLTSTTQTISGMWCLVATFASCKHEYHYMQQNLERTSHSETG
jgi:hypothetical protein